MYTVYHSTIPNTQEATLITIYQHSVSNYHSLAPVVTPKIFIPLPDAALTSKLVNAAFTKACCAARRRRVQSERREGARDARICARRRQMRAGRRGAGTSPMVVKTCESTSTVWRFRELAKALYAERRGA